MTDISKAPNKVFVNPEEMFDEDVTWSTEAFGEWTTEYILNTPEAIAAAGYVPAAETLQEPPPFGSLKVGEVVELSDSSGLAHTISMANHVAAVDAARNAALQEAAVLARDFECADDWDIATHVIVHYGICEKIEALMTKETDG